MLAGGKGRNSSPSLGFCKYPTPFQMAIEYGYELLSNWDEPPNFRTGSLFHEMGFDLMTDQPTPSKNVLRNM